MYQQSTPYNNSRMYSFNPKLYLSNLCLTCFTLSHSQILIDPIENHVLINYYLIHMDGKLHIF